MRQSRLRERVRRRYGLCLPPGELWIFGYGSLMWNPGFGFEQSVRARIDGYHRAFCIYSHRYRGTAEQPGLVLGLDHGGACTGMAFRIGEARMEGVLDDLWEREMSNDTYRPRFLRTGLGAHCVQALAFVVDRRRRQYARGMSAAEAARIIARGCGQRGPNIEYFINTLGHLDALGVHDPHLHEILGAVSGEPGMADVLPSLRKLARQSPCVSMSAEESPGSAEQDAG